MGGLINKFPKNTREFYNSVSVELWPEGVFYKVMRPNSNPRRLHVNVLGRVLKKSRKPEDRLIIMPYQYLILPCTVHTDCPILSDHLLTTNRPLTDHIPTTYRPLFYGAACSQLPTLRNKVQYAANAFWEENYLWKLW